MKADKIFDRVIALCFADTTEKGEMQSQFLTVLEMCAEELLPLENALREGRGLDLLPAAPAVESTESEIPYQAEILSFLPYGPAGLLYMEDEAGIATQYKNKYETERAALTQGRFEEVADEYGGEIRYTESGV